MVADADADAAEAEAEGALVASPVFWLAVCALWVMVALRDCDVVICWSIFSLASSEATDLNS